MSEPTAATAVAGDADHIGGTVGPRDVLPTLTSERPRRVRRDMSRLALGCERLLDGVVVVLATWTAVYHLCLVLRLGAAWAVALEVCSLVVVGVLVRRRRRPDPPRRPPERRPSSVALRTAATGPAPSLLALGVAAALLTALAVAVEAPWPLVATLWLVAAVTGTALTVVRTGGGIDDDATEDAPDRGAGPSAGRGMVVVLAWAVGLAALSMITRWPNPDDLYYVNLSQWVAEHGSFPVRDTIFSDLVFPMSSWPPVASYDALAGTVAWMTGVHAASVVYLVVPPLATFLSVLALWRLQRQWRIEALGVAVSVSLVFLLFDGGLGYAAPGNLFLTRIWQGKVILLCLMVPLLIVHALRYVERPTRARAGWMFAGGVAAVGLSTTAMFLVPLLALAGAAPLVRSRPRQAIIGFLSMSAYPLAAGLVTLGLGGRSADDFDSRRLFRFEPSWFGPEIFRTGPVAAIAVGAVLLAAFALPRRSARRMTGLLAVAVGITFIPGVTDVAYDLVGLGPTLWRVSWVVTIAALVGALGAHFAMRVDRRLRLALPVTLVVVLVGFGQPIWTENVGVALDHSSQWKRPLDTVEAATQVIDAADRGDVVLAPRELAITITVLTTEVKTVAPRAYFMDYLKDEPRFGYEERLTLIDFADSTNGLPGAPEVTRALAVLDVDEVCLPGDASLRGRFLEDQGYVPLTRTADYFCVAR